MSGVFPRFGEGLATFSGKPFVFLLLSLAGACLAQSTLLAVFTKNPEGYLLGVPKWYSALWVLPVLAIAYAVILASHVILCGLEWLLRVSLGWIGLLRPSRSVVNRVRCVKLTLTRDVWFRSREEPQQFKAQHAISAVVLVLLVKLVIPHQFAFIVGFVVHLLTVSSCEDPKVSAVVAVTATRR